MNPDSVLAATGGQNILMETHGVKSILYSDPNAGIQIVRQLCTMQYKQKSPETKLSYYM